ncbi:hypothetical protein WJU23_07130 [Prosthecobacter sp. SYSU 5D2]|uniref:hypothetical protein n=1 Tax=Prosthecobacter sp. SYSU 5D2 TaxID=3134134 RepID=UPI0031FF2B3C
MNYDINDLIQKNANPAEVLFQLWSILSTVPYTVLYHEEQVVLNAWNFDSTYGNGINDLITNENYAVISRGLAAIGVLNVERLNLWKHSIEAVLGRYGLDCNSEEDLVRIERLTIDRRKTLAAELDDAESDFLNDIWDRGIILTSLLSYIKANMNVFLNRKTIELAFTV